MANAYVYILTNQRNTVLYVGSTADLKKRVYLHRQRLIPGFTKKYNVTKLIYFEQTLDPAAAYSRELQIKSGSRAKKITLINADNATWQVLFDTIK